MSHPVRDPLDDPEGLKNQYTDNGILRYQYVFGPGYMSSGGSVAMEDLREDMAIKENDRVFVIGSGMGGECSFLACMAKGVKVFGNDIVKRAVEIAQRNYKSSEMCIGYDAVNAKKINDFIKSPAIEGDPKDGANVMYCACDSLELDLPENSLDFIFTRDSLLHFDKDQKIKMFNLAKKWLKPNGKFLITDYCCGDESKFDTEFKAYLESRPYHLITPEAYANIITSTHLKIIKQDNIRDLWLKHLSRELLFLENHKEDFISKFSIKDFNDLHDGWTAKVSRGNRGMQTWGRFLIENVK